MDTKSLVYSHSALDTFSTCPYKFYRERVVRDIVFEQNEAAAWGDMVHKALESYVKGETEVLPSNMVQYLEVADKVKGLKGVVNTEIKLACTREWASVEFFDKTVFFRGLVDVLVYDPDKKRVLIIDYKTGKSRYGTKDQDMRYALLAFLKYPDVTDVWCRWVYLSENGHVIRKEYKRSDLERLKLSVTEVTDAIDFSSLHDHWICKPSGLCKGWCAVSGCPNWSPPRVSKT